MAYLDQRQDSVFTLRNSIHFNLSPCPGEDSDLIHSSTGEKKKVSLINSFYIGTLLVFHSLIWSNCKKRIFEAQLEQSLDFPLKLPQRFTLQSDIVLP